MRTLKQAADELHISKDRVKYWVKSRGITLVKEGNFTYLTDEQFLDLQAFVAGNRSGKKTGNTPGKNPVNDPLVEMLKTQLETKDRQIQELQKALERAQSLQLVAESKLQMIEDKQKKPGIFSRLFKSQD